ncbi:uncharacterized protein FOMMEDRAFT_80890 [Fomitiporia mediterranea MF3/22]|uniref:uncharacterized protein n=1 Tax=Fomitiporia mediterranea (strain MF3/22) TaxID=694068 RepID=UPI000440979E|nr:uncharacterized protein FOMMEDRAFT_80890 [Fomitiporia mediterranea MF3/22]EJD05055.1 hypothetical protein FOMMEDRAFT_80890 [Fomitiporia mediterranea MF3/22]
MRTSAAPSEEELRKSVFHVRVTREIDAPVERVWDTLTDVPHYHEWCMIVVDASKRKEQDQVLMQDKFLLMTCFILPMTTKPFERIVVVDHQNHRLSWVNIDYPSWAMRAQRWQTLTASTASNGRTRYETWEAFDGVLAYIVKWVLGRKLREAFGAFADALKTRCEG